MSGYVYAIENDAGLVKIGWSSDPETRVVKINTDAGAPCRLVGYVEGTRRQEAVLHGLLKNARVHGEWFDKSHVAVTHFLEIIPARPAKRPKACSANLIAAFIFDAEMTRAEFAALVGVSLGCVHKWARGERTPRPSQMARITAATGGKVTANDFMPPLPAPAPEQRAAG
ncbi:hypothetical protein GCM10008171_32590 [Methylopila jiangsuensis]|uniref:Bacteriophage T5 Orf172 DNA-binding domain-containing protein n=1 Tax=Methylopila jiangsuensis TaxID=586230 RepID=A0A9W6JLH3_9HYPH|nr:GIY-YIG nuclease family protein [Methylopila jiangsuensis]MDR6284605.1 hypothetical protein [Methylopila jiangsuensis]GLK78005.1 hypothetical protein GCM10008171_32590 [Methylopila jiangsuensis]